jgi:dTDP-4-dehydrorhamnose reductase
VKVLITGANGMLGSALCRIYYDQHEVHALHRDEGCFTNCSADYSLDLINTRKVEELFNLIKPDLVIHCAGLTNVDTCEKEPGQAYDLNVAVTENIARFCSDKTKMVYISTDQVYGKADDHSETNRNLQPVNQYGKTKLQGEQKVEELCNNYIIVRTNIFGWNVKHGRVSSAEWIYNSLINGDRITLFTDYTFSPIYTNSLGEAILDLVKMDYNGVINIGSSIPCSKYDFGMLLASTCDLDQSLISAGSIKDNHLFATRPGKLDLDTRKSSTIGLNVPNWQSSVERFELEKKYIIKGE